MNKFGHKICQIWVLTILIAISVQIWNWIFGNKNNYSLKKIKYYKIYIYKVT